MGFIRGYVVLIALFLMPFVCAGVDLHALAGQVKEFAAQIEDPVVAAKLEADADRLVAQPTRLIQQIHTINHILQELRDIEKKGHIKSSIVSLIAGFVRARLDLEEIPHKMLKQKAREYFSEEYPDAEIEFSDKEDGRQLGDRVHIVQSGCPEIIYHIKTHSHGLCAELDSWDSREAEPVRPEEFFVYKFLEHSNLGPEVHFFGYNGKDFYVATKDVGCTESGKVEICTYETVKSTPGLLGIKYPESSFDPPQEASINPKIVQSLVLVDTITRIFGLEDLITNPGNFYFICDTPGHISDFKIIDFRIGHRRTAPSMIFQGLLTGFAGPYCCLGFSDTILQYLFVYKDKIAKIETTKLFFLPKVSAFKRAMDLSLRDIQTLQEAIPTLNKDRVEEYFQYVIANMNAFVKDLTSYNIK